MNFTLWCHQAFTQNYYYMIFKLHVSTLPYFHALILRCTAFVLSTTPQQLVRISKDNTKMKAFDKPSNESLENCSPCAHLGLWSAVATLNENGNSWVSVSDMMWNRWQMIVRAFKQYKTCNLRDSSSSLSRQFVKSFAAPKCWDSSFPFAL